MSADAEKADEIAYLRAALAKIARCEGRYSVDQMTFANNTIEDMAAVAEGALAGGWINEVDA